MKTRTKTEVETLVSIIELQDKVIKKYECMLDDYHIRLTNMNMLMEDYRKILEYQTKSINKPPFVAPYYFSCGTNDNKITFN